MVFLLLEPLLLDVLSFNRAPLDYNSKAKKKMYDVNVLMREKRTTYNKESKDKKNGMSEKDRKAGASKEATKKQSKERKKENKKESKQERKDRGRCTHVCCLGQRL
eukprot:m.254461 g.254461  ORF g.254461 m.254461 type:complete len:106 (+) comp18093_c0_seq1:920-1237(+)